MSLFISGFSIDSGVSIDLYVCAYISTTPPPPPSLDYCSFVESLKLENCSWGCEFSNFPFLFQHCFGCSRSEVTQSCPTLFDPMDCSLPGSALHGIFQTRVLEWFAISFSRGSSWPRDQTPGLLHCRQTLWLFYSPLHFHVNFRICLSVFEENLVFLLLSFFLSILFFLKQL